MNVVYVPSANALTPDERQLLDLYVKEVDKMWNIRKHLLNIIYEYTIDAKDQRLYRAQVASEVLKFIDEQIEGTSEHTK